MPLPCPNHRAKPRSATGALHRAVTLQEGKIPQTKRSDLFTQLLHLAFHKAKVRPEKSQISRWAGALQHAWSQDPRPAPDAVLGFIKREGGDVACAEKGREASRAASGTKVAPVVLKLPFSAVVKATLFTDDRYAFVPRQRIDLQEVREKLSQMREPAPPEPATA